jgi:DNA topoisomerase-2
MSQQQNIKEFFDSEYMDYAVYRIFQRLPHIADCLAQTQREIIYTLETFPESKKHKTAEVYSHVYTKTQYLHGDSSVYNVTENLARECSNNVNFLTQEGSFGSRTNRSAAAPRYTGTRFSKAARLLFPKDDEPIYRVQEFEGKPIEPEFLMPILPALLLNGYSGIAVGFASKILPRDPTELINVLIKALQYHKKYPQKWDEYQIENIQPKFPFYTGHIIHDTEHENKSAWLLTGRLRKSKKRNVIEIYDVPPEYTRESYIKKLKKMLDKGIIKDYKESCRKNSFEISVKVSPDTWKKSEDELIEILGLIDRVSENITFVNPLIENKDTIVKYSTINEYLKDFINIRQEFYGIRKQYQMDKLSEEIALLHQKIRFIEQVNNNEIIITRRKKKELEDELKQKEYHLIDGSFDYLLGMKMHSLTDENIDRFKKYILDKETEFNMLEKTTTEDMHIKELKAFLKFINPELEKKGLI